LLDQLLSKKKVDKSNTLSDLQLEGHGILGLVSGMR